MHYSNTIKFLIISLATAKFLTSCATPQESQMVVTNDSEQNSIIQDSTNLELPTDDGQITAANTISEQYDALMQKIRQTEQYAQNAFDLCPNPSFHETRIKLFDYTTQGVPRHDINN